MERSYKSYSDPTSALTHSSYLAVKRIKRIGKLFWVGISILGLGLALFVVSFYMLIEKGFSGEVLLSVSGIVLGVAGIFISMLSILQGTAVFKMSMAISALEDKHRALVVKVEELKKKKETLREKLVHLERLKNKT